MRLGHTPRVSLTTWRSFVAVCRLGTVSAAAIELGFTQSAVSRQLAALEREVGVPLLHRTPRGVEPTEAGRAFHRHALTVVHEASRAARAARDAATTARPLVVGSVPSLTAGAVPAAVRDLRATVADLRWRLVTDLSADLRDRVLSGEIDIAVVTDAPPGARDDPRLVRTVLGTDEMLVVLPRDHPLARRADAPVTIEELRDEVWAEDNDGSAALLRRHAARRGVDLEVDLVAADLPSKVALVATGHAVALVPSSLASALRPDVIGVRLEDAPARGLSALVPARDPHPAVAALVEHLRARLDPPSPPSPDRPGPRPGPVRCDGAPFPDAARRPPLTAAP